MFNKRTYLDPVHHEIVLDQSSQGSRMSSQTAANASMRSARTYQIMLVAHELVLEGE